MANPDGKPAEDPAASTAAGSLPAPKPNVAEDDSDPDFDDLDDVLDQFSANAPSQSKESAIQPAPQPIPAASGPGRPPQAVPEVAVPSAQQPDEPESEFIERLSKEMSTMFESFAADASQQTKTPEDMSKLTKQLEEFTYQMEKEGIQPQDLLKAILGEEEGAKIASLAQQERDNVEKNSVPSSSSQPSFVAPPKPATEQTSEPATSTSSKPQPKSFEDTIRNTISRLGESDKSATTATQKSAQKSEEDLLADMLRALDAGPSGDSSGAGGDDNLSKMFMDMMQQLTHRDLLYEPMKELNTQYPAWLAANKAKLAPAEFDRFQRQSVIVSDITRKFEEPSFSDDDPSCREFVWEKMQRMQEEGAPPEELVKNPFPGTDFGGGGIPGLGSGGTDQLPEGLSKELEEGCPTQ